MLQHTPAGVKETDDIYAQSDSNVEPSVSQRTGGDAVPRRQLTHPGRSESTHLLRRDDGGAHDAAGRRPPESELRVPEHAAQPQQLAAAELGRALQSLRLPCEGGHRGPSDR